MNYNIERTVLLRKVIIVINLFFNIMSNETFPITGAITSSFKNRHGVSHDIGGP